MNKMIDNDIIQYKKIFKICIMNKMIDGISILSSIKKYLKYV